MFRRVAELPLYCISSLQTGLHRFALLSRSDRFQRAAAEPSPVRVVNTITVPAPSLWRHRVTRLQLTKLTKLVATAIFSNREHPYVVWIRMWAISLVPV